MNDPIAVGKVVPIKKVGLLTTVSFDILWDYHWAERFPRKMHTVTHPISRETRRAYADYKRRFEAMEERAELIAEGEKNRWADDEGGYEWEPARLRELKPKVDFIYEDRVTPIIEHHHQTGEWPVEPQPTLMERLSFGFIRSTETRKRMAAPTV